jgi:hypothetical protein
VLLFALAAHAHLRAQPGPPPIESLEAAIVSARSVYVGTVAEPSTNPRSPDRPNWLSLRVEETIKGAPRKTYSYFLGATVARSPGTRLLVLTTRDDTHASLVVDLTTPEPYSNRSSLENGPTVVTEDCAIIHTNDVLLDTARKAAHLPPSTGTWNWVPSSSSDRGSPCFERVLIVPVDGHLEQAARAALANGKDTYAHQRAIQALAHFKSSENVLLIAPFLTDTSEGFDPDEHESIHDLGYKRTFYTLRSEAYHTMEAWGLNPPKPVLRQRVFEPQNVSVAEWTNAHSVTAQDILDLKRFPNLISLELENLNLTDAEYHAIATLPRLQNLLLAGTNVRDRQLGMLTPLTHLVFINLFETHITEASLPFISNLPELKEVMLTESKGCITQAGVYALQKARPRLKIDFHPPVSPWSWSC